MYSSMAQGRALLRLALPLLLLAALTSRCAVAFHPGLPRRAGGGLISLPSAPRPGLSWRASLTPPGKTLGLFPRGTSRIIRYDSAAEPSPSSTTLWNIPNLLTMARVVAIPVLVLVFYSNLASRALWSSVIFVLAALTDWLDGYLARKWKQSSPFGAFLDPVADKLMVATALLLLSERFASPLVTVSTAVIINREIGVSALREWMASSGQRDVVAVGWWGKVKTATQMVAVSGLLYLQPPLVGAGLAMHYGQALSLACLVVSAVLSVTSASGYLRAAWPVLSGKKQ